MLLAALCAFAAAAVAGIFLAVRHFTKRKLPASVALIHGLGGATGFTFVLLVVVQNPDFRLARQALYIFIVTVLLGAVNLLFHLRKKRHRTSLIVMHALVAVSGVLTLLFAIFGGPPAEAAQPVATQAPATSAAAPAAPAATTSPTPVEATASAPAPAESGAPAAEKAPAATRDLASDPTAKKITSQSVRFESKSAGIVADSLPALAEVTSVLKANPDISLVEVQGHADARGDDARNIALTQGRAAAVVDALVAKGIDRTRLRSAGYGSRCASSGGSDADSTASDRRVSFVVLRFGTASFSGALTCDRGAELIPPADKQFHKP
jgi:outer membrane protein OmpA-like peptidoglycan-associated protein